MFGAPLRPWRGTTEFPVIFILIGDLILNIFHLNFYFSISVF